MGRLFQYNRFGATDNINKNISKKDTQHKNKMLRNAIKCPGYSDIYGQYNEDQAFEKCQQWSNKLQFSTAGDMDKQEPIQSRTHKVYDSMKNFLHRKLFAQPSQKEQASNEEPTSDYDEDLLDSSYHADAEEEEEERDADCSCSSTGESTTSSSPTTPKRSPQKSLLSLNCWQSSQPSSDSNPEEEEEAEEDSDAGISDCCQLLAENSPNSMSKRRRAAPLFSRYISANQNSDDDDDEEPELLACPWYQPRITAKAATEHLQQATPGSFLLRRSTPRHFELVLRLERINKVKSYPVQSTRNQMYRLKGAKKQFTSLKALITHHSVMAEQLPLTLDLPRERHVVKTSSVRYADDFEPLESLQLLGILKSLQAKSIEI
ncbi:uncharacterized G-patch domain protein DDB_G0278987 isoform X2 [Drosophila biarmipes]|uniref:uncharacterized G-patch domain protein DDB_G0278987 isoform X2 n=1 Tax=Drosophila biarmipes TaxID=125945 RepID=UPI0007E7FAE9|nr:uncharacterized G-patch domain protein DDB_G0278987 isoform X2 [Drosophila biarmipes]